MVSTNEVIYLIWRSKVVISLLCSTRIDPFGWESGDLSLSLLGFSTNFLKPAMWKRSSTQVANSKILFQRNGDANDWQNNLYPLKDLFPIGWYKLPKSNLKANPKHKLRYPNWVCQPSIAALFSKAISKNTSLRWVTTILEVSLKLLIHKINNT